jgi:signal transduction histidine kinase
MTIKKRLFISNILMIVMPAIISMITMWFFIIILNAITGGTIFDLIEAQQELRMYRKENYEIRVVLSMSFSVLIFLVCMYFSNRFLTKFIFRKIEQPLNLLAGGVRQISEGNLNHKIIYTENDEFKPICEDFNNMAERLKISDEEIQKNEENRKELLAGISHDLRSPLTSIKAFVEGLLDGVANTPEAQQEYLQIIKQKTEDINNMVSQLFYYSKMDMGNYPIDPEKLNLAKELSDFVDASQEEYKTKGLLIEIKNAPNNKYIFADPLQLRRVFANILSNSAKYKEKETAKASIYCTVNDGVAKIIFEDDGPGVSENALEKIFDVFYRTDPSRNNPHKGSGLGLAITSKVLEQMNGKIYAENISEGGLRVIIEIPEKEDAT